MHERHGTLRISRLIEVLEILKLELLSPSSKMFVWALEHITHRAIIECAGMQACLTWKFEITLA